MDPLRLITYTVLTSVVMLVAMGGAGFYIGYSAGRGDLAEMKALVAATVSPEHAGKLSEMLKEGGASGPDFTPVLQEIRALSTQVGRLEQTGATNASSSGGDGKLRDELTTLRQRLNAASDQYNSCKQDMNILEAKLRESAPAQAAVSTASPKSDTASRDPASVVLFDNVQLKRDQNKLYNDVDVAL